MIEKYALVENGYVTSIVYGEKPDSNWISYPNDAPMLGPYKIKAKNNNVFVIEPLDFSAMYAYDKNRVNNYPSIGDQLDALWKALDPLITHPEARAILNKIQEIKSTYPKT